MIINPTLHVMKNDVFWMCNHVVANVGGIVWIVGGWDQIEHPFCVNGGTWWIGCLDQSIPTTIGRTLLTIFVST